MEEAVFKQTDLTLLQSTACYKNSNKKFLNLLLKRSHSSEFLLEVHSTTCQATPAQQWKRNIWPLFDKVINTGSGLQAPEDSAPRPPPPFFPHWNLSEGIKSLSRPHTQLVTLPFGSAKPFPTLLAFIHHRTRWCHRFRKAKTARTPSLETARTEDSCAAGRSVGAGVSPHRRGPALGVPDGAGGGRRGSGKALAPLPHRRPTGSITPAPPPLAPAPSPHTGRGAPEPHLAPARQSVARPAPLRSPRAGGEAEGRAEDSLAPGLSAAGDAPRASRGSPPPARPAAKGPRPRPARSASLSAAAPGGFTPHPIPPPCTHPLLMVPGWATPRGEGGATETYGRGPAPGACAIQTAPRCMLGRAAPRPIGGGAGTRRPLAAEAAASRPAPPRLRHAAGRPGKPLRPGASVISEVARRGRSALALAPGLPHLLCRRPPLPQTSSALSAWRPAPAVCRAECASGPPAPSAWPCLTCAGGVQLLVGKSWSSSTTSPPRVEPPQARAGFSRPPRFPGCAQPHGPQERLQRRREGGAALRLAQRASELRLPPVLFGAAFQLGAAQRRESLLMSNYPWIFILYQEPRSPRSPPRLQATNEEERLWARNAQTGRETHASSRL